MYVCKEQQTALSNNYRLFTPVCGRYFNRLAVLPVTICVILSDLGHHDFLVSSDRVNRPAASRTAGESERLAASDKPNNFTHHTAHIV